MSQFLVHRVATALADWANDVKMNHMGSWTAHDFAVDAEKFVETLKATAKFHSVTDKEITETSTWADMVEYLQWGITPEYTSQAINVGLFEVGPDITGLDFEPG